MEFEVLHLSCPEDIKSRSGSSSPGSEQEESETEAVKDPREDEKADQPQEVDQEETAVPLDETDPTTETEAAVTKDSDIHNSAGDSTEIDISDTNISSGNKQSDNTSGDREVEKTVDCEQEEEPERGKYKPTDAALELSAEWEHGSILYGGFSTIITTTLFESESVPGPGCVQPWQQLSNYHSVFSAVVSGWDIWSNTVGLL